MKKIQTLLMAILSLCFTVDGRSQDVLGEGVIKMEITEVSSQVPELEMMKGTTSEYHYNADNSLVLASMMGGMVQMTTLMDNETEDLILLFDMMGNKMLVESTKAERDSLQGGGGDIPDIEITYDDTDTKTILGYNCIKATWSTPDGLTFNMYVSDEIQANNQLIQGLQYINLNGFPLEYIIETPQMGLTYTTTEILDEVDSSVFEINTDGYQVFSLEEFMSQMGALGGSLGF